jgi:hypothetical protein
MQNVKERLKNISTQDVIGMSHQEKAWSENRTNKSQPIDYTYVRRFGKKTVSLQNCQKLLNLKEQKREP